MNARLYRSRDDRMVAGVAGGLAAYLNIDPSLVRILWVVLIPLTGGLILLLYLAMALIVPEQRFDDDRWRAWEAQSANWTAPPAEPPARSDDPWASNTAFASDQSATGSSGETPPDTGAVAEPSAAFAPTTSTDAATNAFDPTASGGPMTTGATPPGASGPSWSTPPPDSRPSWAPPPERRHDRTAPLVFGLILVFIGAVLLARSYLPGIDWGLTWPILFVGIGIALLVGSIRRSSSP
jgi:phage shock protein C